MMVSEAGLECRQLARVEPPGVVVATAQRVRLIGAERDLQHSKSIERHRDSSAFAQHVHVRRIPVATGEGERHFGTAGPVDRRRENPRGRGRRLPQPDMREQRHPEAALAHGGGARQSHEATADDDGVGCSRD